MTKFEQLIAELTALFTAVAQTGFAHPDVLGTDTPADKAAAFGDLLVGFVLEKSQASVYRSGTSTLDWGNCSLQPGCVIEVADPTGAAGKKGEVD